MEEPSTKYLQGGLGLNLRPLFPENSNFLSYVKSMSDTKVSYDHLLRDPRFLEAVSEGTGDPQSAQMRFAVEKLTVDFVIKELGNILGLAEIRSGRPSEDEIGADDRLEGGYGRVFMIIPSNEDGTHHQDRKDSNLAVKLIKFNKSVPEYKQCARFIRESIIWSKMKHPNITPILGLWYDFNVHFTRLPCLVSPWFDEGSLVKYLSGTSEEDAQNLRGVYTPIKNRLFFLFEIMSALKYMHTQEIKVVHGDVKTDNILIRDGHAYLCDFGLSRIIGTITGLSSSSTTNEMWLAPEQMDSSIVKATDKSDIYEFGVTFWHVVTGKNPRSQFPLEANKKELDRPQNMPDEAWDFLRRCLDPNPSSRIDSVMATDVLKGFVDRGLNWVIA